MIKFNIRIIRLSALVLTLEHCVHASDHKEEDGVLHGLTHDIIKKGVHIGLHCFPYCDQIATASEYIDKINNGLSVHKKIEDMKFDAANTFVKNPCFANYMALSYAEEAHIGASLIEFLGKPGKRLEEIYNAMTNKVIDSVVTTQSHANLKQKNDAIKSHVYDGINKVYDQMTISQDFARNIAKQIVNSKASLNESIKKVSRDAKLTPSEEKIFRDIFFVTIARDPSLSRVAQSSDIIKLKSELSKDFKQNIQSLMPQLQNLIGANNIAIEAYMKDQVATIKSKNTNQNYPPSYSLQDSGYMLSQAGKLFGVPELQKIGSGLSGTGAIINGFSSIISGGVAFGPIGAIFAGLNSIIGCFSGGSGNSGFKEAFQAIMQSLNKISGQINALHKDVLKNFESVFVSLDFIHKDLLKNLEMLHLGQKNIEKSIIDLLEGQKQTHNLLYNINNNINLMHKDIKNLYTNSLYQGLYKSLLSFKSLPEKITQRQHDELSKEIISNYWLIEAHHKSQTKKDTRQLILNLESESTERLFSSVFAQLGLSNSGITDPKAYSDTISALIGLALKLEASSPRDYVISESHLKNIITLLEKGEAFERSIVQIKNTNVIMQIVNRYIANLSNLNSTLLQEISSFESKETAGNPKFVLSSSQKVSQEFLNQKIAVSLVSVGHVQPCLAHGFGAFRNGTPGYYNDWFVRYSDGKQNPGCDIFDEWYWKPSTYEKRAAKLAELQSFISTKTTEYFKNKQDYDKLPRNHKISLFSNENIDIKTYYHEYFMRCTNLPTLPLPPIIWYSTKNIEFLMAEFLNIGLIEYNYTILGSNMLIMQYFTTLNSGGGYLKPYLLSEYTIPFVVPKHFSHNEGIFRIWFGGNHPAGGYDPACYKTLHTGNGHGHEYFYSMFPNFKQYTSIKDDNESFVKTTDNTANVLKIVSAEIENKKIAMRKKFNENALNVMNTPSISSLLDEITADVRMIQVINRFMGGNDLDVAFPTKDSIINMLRNYSGSQTYISDILANDIIPSVRKFKPRASLYSMSGILSEFKEYTNIMKHNSIPDALYEKLETKHADEKLSILAHGIGIEYGKSCVFSKLREIKATNVIALLEKEILNSSYTIDKHYEQIPLFRSSFILGVSESLNRISIILLQNSASNPALLTMGINLQQKSLGYSSKLAANPTLSLTGSNLLMLE
jgi:hypothetical protein